MNNATIVELQSAGGVTCFISTAGEVYCFGIRKRSGTSDKFPDGDYYIGDNAGEMASLKKVEFNFNAFGGSSVNASLNVFIVAFVSLMVGVTFA